MEIKLKVFHFLSPSSGSNRVQSTISISAGDSPNPPYRIYKGKLSQPKLNFNIQTALSSMFVPRRRRCRARPLFPPESESFNRINFLLDVFQRHGGASTQHTRRLKQSSKNVVIERYK